MRQSFARARDNAIGGGRRGIMYALIILATIAGAILFNEVLNAAARAWVRWWED